MNSKFKHPLGLLLNNPGNLRSTGVWPGWVGQTGAVDGFARFGNPLDGCRALLRDLIVKQTIDHLTTIAAIVDKYAPPSENNTTAYMQAVADRVGKTTTQQLNPLVDTVALAMAMSAQELGSDFYGFPLWRAAVNMLKEEKLWVI